MKASDYVGAKANYLNVAKAKELGVLEKSLTIKDVTEEKIAKEGEKEKKKLLLHFAETDAGLVLNSTNNAIISDAYGDDTDNWLKKKIKLRISKVMFQGKMVDGLQVNIS
jgi:hypothetical protein